VGFKSPKRGKKGDNVIPNGYFAAVDYELRRRAHHGVKLGRGGRGGFCAELKTSFEKET